MRKSSFNKIMLARMSTVEYWSSLNPDLTISKLPFNLNTDQYVTKFTDTDCHVRQMLQQGYFKLDSVLPGPDIELMANAIMTGGKRISTRILLHL